MASFFVSAVFLVLVSASSLLLLRWGYVQASEQLPLPPGPPSDPVIGHVRIIPSSYPWKTFAEWGKVWGGLININVFGKPIVIINDPKTARELMDKRGAFYSDRPRFVLHCEIMGWDKVISFLPYGNKYRRQRKMMMQHFNAQAVARYRPIQKRELYRLLNNLLDSPDAFYHHSFRATASTITMATYGYEVASENDPYVKIVEKANLMTVEPGAPGSTLPDLFPILRFIPKWFPGAGFKRHALKANDLIQEMLDLPFNFVKRNRSLGTAVPSFVLSLLDEYERPGEVDIEREEDIKAVSGNIYSAGVETTNSVKLAFILAMVRNQDVVKKAQAEIDRVVGQDRLPTLKDRDGLPYIDCILKETLRWNPPVPLSIPHRVEKEDTYNGMRIPKGATVIPNIWQIMRNEHYYPEPEKFNPDRFLRDPMGQLDKEEYDPFNSVFGFGRRICPGRFFAEVGLWLTIANILAAFDIKPVLDDKGQECVPEAKFTSGFSTQPEEFHCSITPRNERYVHYIRQADRDQV